MEPMGYIEKGKIRDPAKFRTSLRHGLGAMIWLQRTRPDIGYDIAKLATDAVAAADGPELGKKIVSMCNKIVRVAQLRDRKLALGDSEPLGTSLRERMCSFPYRRIVCFADSGFSTPHGSRWIEGSVTVLGKGHPRRNSTLPRFLN